MLVKFILECIGNNYSDTFGEFPSSKEIHEEATRLSNFPNVINVQYFIYYGEVGNADNTIKVSTAIKKYASVPTDLPSIEVIHLYQEEACHCALHYLDSAEEYYNKPFEGDRNNILELSKYLKEYMYELFKGIQYIFKISRRTSFISTTHPEVYVRHNLPKAKKIVEKMTDKTGSFLKLIDFIKSNENCLDKVKYIDCIISAYNRIKDNSYKGFEKGDASQYVKEHINEAYIYGQLIYTCINMFLDIECKGHTLKDYAHNIIKYIDNLVDVMQDNKWSI